MTTVNENQPASVAEANLKQYADDVIHCIQELRHEKNFSDSEPIAAYVTNTEVMRSLLKQYRSYIEEKANIADLVQVNIDAGNPMPDNVAKKELDIGDQEIIIGIDRG
ncbi:MAG: hypothetical protein U0350_17115 [Caldilineaceae bacterium]